MMRINHEVCAEGPRSSLPPVGSALRLRYLSAMRTPVPLKHACRLLNHGPTTLIATAHDGRRNVMAAQWVMPLDFHPPLLAAVLSADTFTRELLDASGRCVVMLPTTAQVDIVYAVGSCSGRDEDKFDKESRRNYLSQPRVPPRRAGKARD
jgi:flavin reductase (DIM6/NTAB) family NADH-FMN oxidoreductase RutF